MDRHNYLELMPGDGYRNQYPERRPVVGELQDLLNRGAGYTLDVDGFFGPSTQEAVKNVQEMYGFYSDQIVRPALWHWLHYLSELPQRTAPIAWGGKVTRPFRLKVLRISDEVIMHEDGPDWLMAVMAWETGESFNPRIKNLAGSGATGLIQFMPFTAGRLLGMPDSEAIRVLESMTGVEQLDLVREYLLPFKGRLNTLSDLYMAVLYPAAVGKAENYVLFSSGIAYRQNAGLDLDRDNRVTKYEATQHVREKLSKGMQFAA